jgi:CHASE3 domain sensor protein
LRLKPSRLIDAWPILAALLLSGAISFSYNRLLKEYRDAVDHTFRVLGAIDASLLLLQDAETGQRGFIITGDDSYLAPFQAGRDKIPSALDDLAALVADNATHLPRIESLRRLSGVKLSELQDTIATRRDEGFDAAQRKIRGNDGKITMDQIRETAAGMRANEMALFETRVSNARFAERAIVGVAVVCIGLSILGRVLAGYLARRRRRLRAG